nr:hypothetical protein [Massilia sp. BSC265]
MQRAEGPAHRHPVAFAKHYIQFGAQAGEILQHGRDLGAELGRPVFAARADEIGRHERLHLVQILVLIQSYKVPTGYFVLHGRLCHTHRSIQGLVNRYGAV